MKKSKNPSNSECYTPSSEPFRIYSDRCSQTFQRNILSSSSILKKETVCPSETLMNLYRTTWRYIPEYRSLHNHSWENLRCYKLWHVDPLLGNDSVKTFPRQRIRGSNRITFVSMQRDVKTTILEELFYMWFAYIHCWATDVFSMGPPRDYISSTEWNELSRTRMGRVLGSQGRRVRLKIDCEFLSLIVIKRDCKRRC
jgi:hypothetical protein